MLKQSPSAVDVLADVFKLTSEEKKRLSQFPVGQGLFFAGQNHVHIQVIASPTESDLINTNPVPVAQRGAANEAEVDLQKQVQEAYHQANIEGPQQPPQG